MGDLFFDRIPPVSKRFRLQIVSWKKPSPVTRECYERVPCGDVVRYSNKVRVQSCDGDGF
jgi:hypothetical protein